MPVFVTVRDGFLVRGSAGVSFPAPANPRRFSLPPANSRRSSAGGASSSRVIHMLINDLGMQAPRYLPVTITGGGWTRLGGGWKQPKNATPRHFHPVNPQVTTKQRGMAGVGGGYFSVLTSESSDETPQTPKPHVFANRPLTTPANPRRAVEHGFRSHHVTTKATR